MFSHMGPGGKQITDRFQQYPSAPYTQEAYNPYMHETAAPAPYAASSGISHKHGHHGGHKGNAAMSALTLLAFLFFLNILQQCLKDHMTSMNTAPIMVMTGGREGEETVAKTAEDAEKFDKTGQIDKPVDSKPINSKSVVSKPVDSKTKPAKIDWVTSKDDRHKDDRFTKISLERPRNENGFPGFVSAMKVDY